MHPLGTGGGTDAALSPLVVLASPALPDLPLSVPPLLVPGLVAPRSFDVSEPLHAATTPVALPTAMTTEIAPCRSPIHALCSVGPPDATAAQGSGSGQGVSVSLVRTASAFLSRRDGRAPMERRYRGSW